MNLLGYMWLFLVNSVRLLTNAYLLGFNSLKQEKTT